MRGNLIGAIGLNSRASWKKRRTVAEFMPVECSR